MTPQTPQKNCEQYRTTQTIADITQSVFGLGGSVGGVLWYRHYKKRDGEKTSGWGYVGWFLLGGMVGGTMGLIPSNLINANVPPECVATFKTADEIESEQRMNRLRQQQDHNTSRIKTIDLDSSRM